MLNYLSSNNKKKYNRICFTILIFLGYGLNVFASDLSDATTLRERCEKEAKVLEIAVKNFGSPNDLADYNNGLKLIKTGKLMMAQSKYLDASAKYKEYLKLQNQTIYKNLAESYLKRTETVLNEISSEFVDSIDNEKVDKYLKLANQNLFDAKASMTRKNYTNVIEGCRLAKNYVINIYKILGKDIPEKYKIDALDNDKKMK